MISLFLAFIIGAIVVYFLTRPRPEESGTPEGFSLSKFIKAFKIFDPVEWVKTIAVLFNIRALIIYGVIGLGIYGYAYYQGAQNKPINIDLGYGKEAIIELNTKGDALHIDKDGSVHIQDKKGNIIKVVTVRDISSLKDVLAPYGFELKPFVFGGMEASISDGGLTGGVGVSIYRFYKFTVDGLISISGVYVGTSYQVTDNSGVGIAVGKGWEGDNRGMIYYRWNF